MELHLDKRALRQIRLSAQEAIEEDDTESLREDVLEAFTEEQVEEIERRLDNGDFYEFLTDVLDEWSGDDVDELLELLETQLGEVGIDLKTDNKSAEGDSDDEGGADADADDDDDYGDDDEEEEEGRGRRRSEVSGARNAGPITSLTLRGQPRLRSLVAANTPCRPQNGTKGKLGQHMHVFAGPAASPSRDGSRAASTSASSRARLSGVHRPSPKFAPRSREIGSRSR